MADSTAQFQEVLELRVDLEIFKQEMAKVADIYKDSLKNVGNQSIGTSEVVQGIRDLQSTIERLGSAGGKVLNGLTQTMVDTAGTIEKGVAGINAGLDSLGKNAGPSNTSVGLLSANTSFGQLAQSFANIPNMIGNVLALNLAWKVAGEVIRLAGEAIAAPFKAIQEGLQYARQLQQTTADLQGVIAANITLSKDYPTNFRLAGEAAEVVRKKLEDIAIATGLTTQGLQSAFKQVLEAGGGAFVNNIDQLVKLTELFGVSMRAAGRDVNATRALISEVPKLLDGSVASSSKLLEVLHLTKDQWEQIRVSALAHHNLLEQLEPILKPYLDVVSQADLRQQVLLDQLDLMKKRIEAAFSADVFTAFTNVLTSAKDLLLDQQGRITAIGRLFSDQVVTVIQLGVELAKTFGGPAIVTLAHVLNELNFIVKTIINGLGELAGIVDAFGSKAEGEGFLDRINNMGQKVKQTLDVGGQKFADDLERAAANAADIDQNTTKFRDAFERKLANRGNVPAEAEGNVVQTGSGAVVQAATPATGFIDNTKLLQELTTRQQIIDSTKPGPGKEKNNALQELRQELTARIDAIKEEAQQELDVVTRLEHLKEISSETASASRVALLKQQLRDIGEAADAVLNKAQTSGLNKSQLESLVSLVERTKSIASRSEDKSVTAEQDKNTDKQFKQVDDELTREKALYDKHQQALLALDKEYLKEKLVTNEHVAQSEIDTANRAYEFDRHILEQKFINAKADLDLKLKIGQDLEALDQAQTDRLIQDSARLRAARERDRDAEAKHQQQVAQLNISNLEGDLKAGQQSGSLSQTSQQTLKIDIAQEKLKEVNNQLAEAGQKLAQVQIQSAAAGYDNSRAVREATLEVMKLAGAAEAAAAELEHQKALQTVEGKASNTLFGTDSFKDAFKDVGKAGESLKSATQFAIGSVQQIQQGFKDGGIAGGIGAILQNPLVGTIPVVGPFLQAGGAILSALSGLFTSAARHIGEEVKKEIDKTLKDINNGTLTPAAGIAQLQAERADAIARLSGQKGGQDQLNKILPGLDDAIAQLKKQIAQVKQSFEDALAILQNSNGSDVTAKWLQDWQAINKQVKDYLDAVGAAGNANAQAFLQLELAKERTGLQNQLNTGQQNAINDAISLNDLLKQRNDLESNYARTKFGLLSADSVERRGTGAILAGQQLAQAAKDQQAQLDSLNYQIATVTQKLSVEKQVFNIATDTATLQQQSLALQLIDLNKLKQTYLDIQSILAKTANLIAGPTGSFFGTPILPGVAPIPGFGTPTPPPINITVNGYNADQGRKLAGDLYNELYNRFRSGGYAFR